MAFTLPLSTMRPVAIPGTILSRNCKLRRTKMKDEKREREKAFRMANSSWKTRIVRRSNYRMNEFGRGENSLHLPFHGNLNSLFDDGGGEEKKEEERRGKEKRRRKDGNRTISLANEIPINSPFSSLSNDSARLASNGGSKKL